MFSIKGNRTGPPCAVYGGESVQQNLAIEMENISKVFGSLKANNNVNLSVRKGEVHALLGENGAGKSTLMNMLSGIYTLRISGTIKIDGQEGAFCIPRRILSVWGSA